jgi:FIMAH domain
MKRSRHRISDRKVFWVGTFCVSILFVLILSYGETVWGADTTTPQGMIDQITNFITTGQIYEKAAGDDLTSMLTTVNTFIQLGDNITAKSLLAGFVNTVQEMTNKLMSSTAAQNLIDSANSLSMSL